MIDKIGYLLLKKGIIDAKILDKALQIKREDQNGLKRNLAQILVQELKFDHDTIFREVALLYAFKEINFKIEDIPEDKREVIRSMINGQGEDVKNLLLESKILPLRYDDKFKDKIVFAAVDPTSKDIIKVAHAFNTRKYEINYLKKADYDKAIEILVPPENKFLTDLQNFKEEISMEILDESSSIDEEQLNAEINKSALINLIEGALVDGVRRGVSDIHFIPKNGNRTEIHFRQDGKLQLWKTQTNTLPEAVMAVVKDRSKGMDRFEREMAQDGYIQRNIDGRVIRFRVSVLPVVGTEVKHKFESIVIRILDDSKIITDLDKLGLIGYGRKVFEKAIRQPQGMVIMTGPTGSGKSTTLVAALYQVINPTKNVLTVEDPVEYVIEGARQLKIGHKMNFEQAIRSILRHDPDIVLVGEMRDKETAETAIKLANTGHLTFSTLHTNDAPSAVARLFKMGVEPFLIAYAINLIVAQRLLRRLCPICKKRVEEYDGEYFKSLNLDVEEWKQYEIFEPVGCSKCHNTGYKGRLAIHESLYFTKDIREIIVRSGEEVDEEKIRIQAKKDGTLNLRESGLEKVRLGMTSIAEVVAGTTDD
ncbi:MAG: type II/IV secretion system protein [Ignavibacteria bacterium]|nr:type II/IV secretion system protein [Ignavibacteria bacterium]